MVEDAIEAILEGKKIRTPDLGGSSTTEEVGRAVAEYILRSTR